MGRPAAAERRRGQGASATAVGAPDGRRWQECGWGVQREEVLGAAAGGGCGGREGGGWMAGACCRGGKGCVAMAAGGQPAPCIPPHDAAAAWGMGWSVQEQRLGRGVCAPGAPPTSGSVGGGEGVGGWGRPMWFCVSRRGRPPARERLGRRRQRRKGRAMATWSCSGDATGQRWLLFLLATEHPSP